jgi:branched-chain amino acid transport system permease protein
VLEGITKLVYPDGAGMVVFVVMLIVLAVRPQGLFGSLR